MSRLDKSVSPAKKDSTLSEEYDLEEIANEISKTLGVPIARSQALVDQYRHYAWFALSKIEQRMAEGRTFASPYAVMISMLRSGEIQSEVAAGMWEIDEPEPDPEVERLHERYHAQQAAPDIDTAAKRLARAAGLSTVKCACGAEFATVSPRG